MEPHQTKREYLREQRKQQKRKNTTTVLLIALTAVLLILLVIFLPKLLSPSKSYNQQSGFSIGNPQAPVTVVEFSNYGCSHCKTFAESVEDEFFADYVETGDVYFTFVNLPYSDEEHLNAAEASYCAAEQNKFYDYKKLLFTYSGSTGAFTVDRLTSYARNVKLDVNAFTACMDSNQYAEAYLNDFQYANAIGLTGTPSFLINGDQLVYAGDLFTTLDAVLGR